MRLFVAIDLDDDARRAIAAEQKRLTRELAGEGKSSLRMVNPEHMHLTLAFLGEVDTVRGAAVAEVMGQDVEAAAVTLYQSRLSPSGPSYTALAQAALRP